MPAPEIDQERGALIATMNQLIRQGDFTYRSNVKFDNLSVVPPHELNALSMGSGVTGRTLERLRSDIAEGVVEKVIENAGETIFLGNGSSNVPLEISNIQKGANRTPNKKVIIDQVDLPLLLEDLTLMDDLLHQKGFSETFDIGAQRQKVLALVEAARDPQQNLSIRTGLIGVDRFEDLEGTADLVLNAWGPSAETLAHQMQFLRSGGVLLMPGRFMNFNRMLPTLQASGAMNSVDRIEELGGKAPDWKYTLKFTKK